MGFVLLMSIAFVSCNDEKLTEKDDKTVVDEGDIYLTVQDSVFRYQDGKLLLKTLYSYCPDGRFQSYSYINYSKDGKLIHDVEGTFDYTLYVPHKTYSDYEYTVNYNNHGLWPDIKEVRRRTGSPDNYKGSVSQYFRHDGEWLMRAKRESGKINNVEKENSVHYALNNGNLIVVSSKSSEMRYDPQTGKESYYENESYEKDVTFDENDLYQIYAQSVIGEIWNKEVFRSTDESNVQEYVTWASYDSLDWFVETRRLLSYDSNGNLIEDKQSGDRMNDFKATYEYNNHNDIIKVEYYNADGNGGYIESGIMNYYYSLDGQLDSVEFVCRYPELKLPAMYSLEDGRPVFSFYLNNTKSDYEVTVQTPFMTKCVIKIDSSGNPLSEILYKLQDGVQEEYARCSLQYDATGNYCGYVVSYLESDEWVERESEKRSLDAAGRPLSVESKTVTTFVYSNYTITETKITLTEKIYNEIGGESYSGTTSLYNQHWAYKDGSSTDITADTKEEKYSSVIKVK